MSLHHVRLIHGPQANVTPELIPARQQYRAVVVRGCDTAGHWHVRTSPPDYALFDEAHGEQQEAASRHLEELAQQRRVLSKKYTQNAQTAGEVNRRQ